MRRPSGSQLAEQTADLIAVLTTAVKVLPTLEAQARMELRELSGGLPTAQRGADYSGDPPPYYQDPTGETVISFRAPTDGNCDPTADLERLARYMSEVRHLIGTARRLLNQAPAVTLAVVDGRKPTDGRSAEEHAQRRFVRALTDSKCLVDQDHDKDDRYGPGQLRRGLCDRHRKAFTRWMEQESADLFGLDQGEIFVRWQMAAFGVVAGRDRDQAANPYKGNLREVA